MLRRPDFHLVAGVVFSLSGFSAFPPFSGELCPPWLVAYLSFHFVVCFVLTSADVFYELAFQIVFSLPNSVAVSQLLRKPKLGEIIIKFILVFLLHKRHCISLLLSLKSQFYHVKVQILFEIVFECYSNKSSRRLLVVVLETAVLYP